MVEGLTFGKVIAIKREEVGMARAELARRIGITPQYLENIEKNGKVPESDKIEKIAGVLEIDEVYLFKLADRLPNSLIEEIKRDYYARAVNPFDDDSSEPMVQVR